MDFFYLTATNKLAQFSRQVSRILFVPLFYLNILLHHEDIKFYTRTLTGLTTKGNRGKVSIFCAKKLFSSFFVQAKNCQLIIYNVNSHHECAPFSSSCSVTDTLGMLQDDFKVLCFHERGSERTEENQQHRR